MSVQLSMFDLLNLEDSRSAISSPVSASGPTPCEKPDGQIIDPSGQAPVPADLSARQAKNLDLMTSGTFGPPGTTSSASLNLKRSLANRYQAKTDLLGSTLFKMTWKERTTPAQALIFARRASVRRTSDSAFTSWPTASASDYKGGYEGGRIRNGKYSTDRLDVTAHPIHLLHDPLGHGRADGIVVTTEKHRLWKCFLAHFSLRNAERRSG